MNILTHISYWIFMLIGIFALFLWIKTNNWEFLVSGVGILIVICTSYIQEIKVKTN